MYSKFSKKYELSTQSVVNDFVELSDLVEDKKIYLYADKNDLADQWKAEDGGKRDYYIKKKNP